MGASPHPMGGLGGGYGMDPQVKKKKKKNQNFTFFVSN